VLIRYDSTLTVYASERHGDRLRQSLADNVAADWGQLVVAAARTIGLVLGHQCATGAPLDTRLLSALCRHTLNHANTDVSCARFML
jgi:hypothetical protein